MAVPLMSVEEMKKVAGGDGNQSPSEALHDEHDDGTVAFDDLTGDELKRALMKLGRKEKIKYFKVVRRRSNTERSWEYMRW